MRPTSTEDNLIFHYTSTETLLNILSRRHDKEHLNKNKDNVCFRATHAKFLNDPTEYEFALTLLEKSLLKYEKENPGKNGVSQIFTKDSKSDLISLAPGEPFLFSLAEHSDNLSMWRAYGTDGSGVSIGLDKKMLNEYANAKDIYNTSFIQCSYGLNKNISRLTTFWSTLYDNMPLYIQKRAIEGRDFQKFLRILEHCFSIKSEAYKEENEWRLCTNEAFKKNIKYRIRSGLIIPYIEHYFIKDIIKRIVIGPCADKELSEKSIIMVLKTFGYNMNNISVIKSIVPYRV